MSLRSQRLATLIMPFRILPLALLTLVGGPSRISGEDAITAKRPNILFILVDDQSPFDLKVDNSQSKLDAPNIERLAREGMTFTLPSSKRWRGCCSWKCDG